MNIWQAFVGVIASALTTFADLIGGLGIPYSFGLAIILFTLVIKLLTLPLTLQQLRASKAMQDLQPELQQLQKKYKGDREKLAQAQMELYKQAGVNPLGGCLPMVVQLPIWFALYRALFQLAQQGVLNEGFLWIPSLAGPVDQFQGLSWLWPLPPAVGWGAAAAYLVLPVLTIVSQIVVQKMMTPTNPDPQQASMNQMMLLMPFMFGFFALQVPQGLALYWVTSNIFSLIQQYFVTGWGSLRPAPGIAEASVTTTDGTPPDSKRTKKDVKRKRKR
ncbi:MAG: YidC/Oxa1 family membrane protein insertase [Anaerolineae bacterium]